MTSNSPQNIDITIDEYIRYEDIKQPYPVIFQIKDRNTNQIYSWGDKIKVGSSIQLSQGNHGVIHNSAYAGASGANGYKQDFTSWKTNSSRYSIVTDSKYILTNEKAITNEGYFLWNRLAKDSFKVKISNIPNGGWMSYRYKVTEEDTQVSSLFIREDGIYTLPATIADSEVDFFISTVSAPAKDWVGLTIEQIGEYEGAYCLDGVDDFITIPTLSSGGKQVLMKVNWQSIAGTAILYDQRTNGGFTIFNI